MTLVKHNPDNNRENKKKKKKKQKNKENSGLKRKKEERKKKNHWDHWSGGCYLDCKMCVDSLFITHGLAGTMFCCFSSNFNNKTTIGTHFFPSVTVTMD